MCVCIFIYIYICLHTPACPLAFLSIPRYPHTEHHTSNATSYTAKPTQVRELETCEPSTKLEEMPSMKTLVTECC